MIREGGVRDEVVVDGLMEVILPEESEMSMSKVSIVPRPGRMRFVRSMARDGIGEA